MRGPCCAAHSVAFVVCGLLCGVVWG
jgi:hypothetical protein